ncbi:MAG: DUF5655 domain-containing protein [Bacteroidota bacterium]
MATTLQTAEANQIKNLKEKTGKPLAYWTGIVNSSKLEKHGELVNMLKENYKLGHGNANLIVHHAKQSHATVAGDDDLVAEQYKDKEALKKCYDKIMAEVKGFGSDVEVSPKKAYVSLRRKKQFAIIQPSTKTRLDVGLNLKNLPPTNHLEAAGSWNSMCTHRVKIENENAIDATLMGYIKQAYEQAG